MLRRVVLAGVSICALALAFGLGQSAQAQASAAPGEYCWRDSATGKPIRTYPRRTPLGHTQEAMNTGRAHLLDGTNAVQDANGNWINSQTGEHLDTLPERTPIGHREEAFRNGRVHLLNGVNAVRYPCPPPSTVFTPGGSQVGWSGGYFGGEIIKNGARVKTTETSAATGAVTNQFSDDGDPVGGGILAGWNFAPWNNNIIVGPFVSVDWLRMTVNHTFPAGFYLGTTTNWIVNVGAKAGFVVTPGVYLYGLAGAAWLNQDLNISFAPGLSAKNTTTPGFTLGLGGEYHPASWQLFGHPVSVFVQYQHTWYDTANFNTPMPASPLFNYAFKRDDDTVKLGVNVYLSAPPQTRAIVTK
jgi:hypothetical protein